MVSFKFSFGVVGKSKEKGIVNKYVIIVAKCEGIIRYIDGTYKVEYNGKLYSITGESYRTKRIRSIRLPTPPPTTKIQAARSKRGILRKSSIPASTASITPVTITSSVRLPLSMENDIPSLSR